jgi:hypothetical protein
VVKRATLFVAAIIATCLVLLPSCDTGSNDESAGLEGIWVATWEEEGMGKALLFEFSGNEFTRIAYTELDADAVDPDGPDMYQDEGNKGTYSVSDDILTVTITEDWDESDWSAYSGSRSVEIDLQGDTLIMYFPDIDPLEFEKKSFSMPSALFGAYDLTHPEDQVVLFFNADATFDYDDIGDSYEAEGTWSASPDLLRFITTYEKDGETESTFYIENLYEYDISEGTLTLSWDGEQFYTYSNE